MMQKLPNRGISTLSATEYLILSLLQGNRGREMYGLEMVGKSDGKLKKGTVYVLLGRLEEKGFVKARQEEVSDTATPRRLYRLTGTGQKVFDAWSQVAALGALRGAVA